MAELAEVAGESAVVLLEWVVESGAAARESAVPVAVSAEPGGEPAELSAGAPFDGVVVGDVVAESACRRGAVDHGVVDSAPPVAVSVSSEPSAADAASSVETVPAGTCSVRRRRTAQGEAVEPVTGYSGEDETTVGNPEWPGAGRNTFDSPPACLESSSGGRTHLPPRALSILNRPASTMIPTIGNRRELRSDQSSERSVAMGQHSRSRSRR